MSRLDPKDSVMDVIVNLSGGIPGAGVVCAELFRDGGLIDPDAALGGLNPLVYLDELELYGSDIWILHKYVCGMNLLFTAAVIRAFQLGLVSKAAVQQAVQAAVGRPRTVFVADPAGTLEPLDPKALLAKVREQLPRFGKGWEAAHPSEPQAVAE